MTKVAAKKTAGVLGDDLALNAQQVSGVRADRELPVVWAGIGEELDKGGWRVVEDPQVGRGGCKVDTASNQIDATAASRWQRLSHALGKEVDWLD